MTKQYKTWKKYSEYQQGGNGYFPFNVKMDIFIEKCMQYVKSDNLISFILFSRLSKCLTLVYATVQRQICIISYFTYQQVWRYMSL